MTIEDLDNSQNFVKTEYVPTDIKVVGVGGGGNNAINYMYSKGVKQVSYVVINTDKQALDNSPVPTKLLIGPTTTRGKGAGNRPEVARAAAEESAEDIEKLFSDGTNMVFITAGMGGGTGTGAAPVIARIAKEKGLLTIGIVTIPFRFEREKKIAKAINGAQEMYKCVDALMVINNERLTEIYSGLNFLTAFHKADETLANAASSISDLINKEGHINLDFNDVDFTLRKGGAAIISSGFGEGEHRVTKAIEDALNSPLLKDRDIFTSKRFLFNIYFDPNAEEEFMMSEADELTAFMSNLDPDVDAVWGVAFDDTLGNKVKISILAAGFDITLHDGANGTKVYNPAAAEPESEKTPSTSTSQEKIDMITEFYGKDKSREMQRDANHRRFVIIPHDKLDDDSALELIETVPTARRDKATLDEIKAILTRSEKQTGTNTSIKDNPPSNPLAGTSISF